MPAQSKSQQRFFGVVKAMQKGDIPKKGRAGKIAKTMDKDDVDDFASTKHKGKPEKVKREQRVRNLIKKMVREELNEKIGKGLSFDDLRVGKVVHYDIGVHYKVKKLSSGKATLELFHTLRNVNKAMYSKKFDISKKDFNNAVVNREIRVVTRGSSKLDEGTCGYGENGQLGEEPAGPHLIKKKKIKESGRNIAKTILQQLGGNKFIAMTGAKNLGFTNNGLQMKIGRNSKGITHVIISLKSTDTYDVEFIKMRGVNRKVVKKLKGVYADQLGKIYTKFTGLRTRL